MSDTTITPQTAENATQTVAIDLSQTQLLGLFSGTGVPRALLRGPDGNVKMARVHDRTPMGDVTAITDTYVLLQTDGTIRRLTLPV